MRSAATAASIVSAARSPLTVWPPRVRPEYANVVIPLPLSFCCSDCDTSRSDHVLRLHGPRGGDRADRPSHARTGHDADAPRDHVLELVLVRRCGHRGVEGDQALLIEARERLVRRLHPELLLPGLHLAVDLVDLV